MIYDIAETFYSLQGEGFWVGTPVFFIRLGGCNINCEFCDTDYASKYSVSVEELVSRVLKSGAERVVITGGEPGLQDTWPLVEVLQYNHLKVHVETNGTKPLHNLWNWITVSPKGPVGQLDPSTILMANEIKFLVGTSNWQRYIYEVIERFFKYSTNIYRIFYLMPLAKSFPFRSNDGLIEQNIKDTIQYCLDHPQFRFCMQLHKVLNVK